MISATGAQRALAYLGTHAKIHRELDTLDRRYRTLLMDIERKEILAYDDDLRYLRLEDLKRELIAIRFVGKRKEGTGKEEITGPSP